MISVIASLPAEDYVLCSTVHTDLICLLSFGLYLLLQLSFLLNRSDIPQALLFEIGRAHV